MGVPSHDEEDAGESAILCSPLALSKEALISFCTTLEEEEGCALEQEESMVETFINISSRGKDGS